MADFGISQKNGEESDHSFCTNGTIGPKDMSGDEECDSESLLSEVEH